MMPWLPIVLGILAGFLFGSGVAWLNFRFTLKATKNVTDAVKTNSNIFMKVYILRQVVNIAALFCIFFLRNVLPIPFYYPLIGTAIGLALPAQILAVQLGQKKKKPAFPGEKN